MKLSTALRRKAFPLILMYSIASILCCLMVPIATGSSSTVTFRVEDVTKDVYAGYDFPGLVAADIYIDSPEGSAIIGWTVDIKVNPDVLEPGYDFGDVYWASSGFSGYFLYDWATPNGYATEFDQGAADVTAGTITGTIEAISGWSWRLDLGEGANGTGKLVTLFFTYKNETAYSPIEITEAYYYTSLKSPNLDKRVPDIIFHGHYNEPTYDVAVTAISAPSQATVGDIVPINVTVDNLGAPAVLNLTLTYDTAIETRLMSLASAASKTESFTWNTTGLTPGEYVIEATAVRPGDVDPNNNFDTTTIKLKQVVFPVTVDGLEFNVVIESNSTVSDFDFRKGEIEIRFSVAGPNGTVGFCNVIIPMGLMTGEPWLILIDGVETTYIQSDNGTHTFLYLTYTHTTHDIIIRGTWVVPEFPTPMPLLLMLAILAVSTIILKRRTRKHLLTQT